VNQGDRGDNSKEYGFEFHGNYSDKLHGAVLENEAGLLKQAKLTTIGGFWRGYGVVLPSIAAARLRGDCAEVRGVVGFVDIAIGRILA
jgi:hypothetical protein